jgi:hypothetical protein
MEEGGGVGIAMAMSGDDKKRWKEEAEQLKKDLDNKPKQIVRREVPIRMAKNSPKGAAKSGPKNSAEGKEFEERLRKSLGL